MIMARMMVEVKHGMEHLFEKASYKLTNSAGTILGIYSILYVPHANGTMINKGEKYPFFINFNFSEGNAVTNETAVVYENKIVGFYTREIDKGSIQSKFEAEHIYFKKLHQRNNLLSLLSDAKLPEYLKEDIKHAFCIDVREREPVRR